MTKVQYDQDAIRELSDRTGYEAWLLEAIYTLLEEELFSTFPDEVIYPLGNSNPEFMSYMRGKSVIGDWRPGFLKAGAPLVFTSTFKLLDMFLEWVLVRNGHRPNYRFAEKIKMLQGQLTYPPVVEDRPWLQEHLRSLYGALEPLRGTVIHSRHFRSTDGLLHISSSRNGVGEEVHISSHALRTFATLCLSVLRYVEGTWSFDPHKENLLRWQLDQLAYLHQMPAFGQKEPYRTTVRVFLEGDDPRSVDIAKVRKDLKTQYPQFACVFDVRTLQVKEGTVIAAYLFPWAVLDEVGKLADPSQYSVDVPQDLDPHHYAACGAVKGPMAISRGLRHFFDMTISPSMMRITKIKGVTDMALINCAECNKQISDKAVACPHCGAPVSAPPAAAPLPPVSASPAATATAALADTPQPSKKKTNPITWLALLLVVVAAFWYFPKAQREASLPTMPVEVKFRNALTGPGLVLIVKNTSDRYLTFKATLKNPTTNQEKSFRLDAAPSALVEVGYKEGWTLASGDNLKIENNDYQSWAGNIP